MNLYKIRWKTIWSITKETYLEWEKDEPYRLSAIIAYYAILSLPSMLVIIIRIAGSIFDPASVQGEVYFQINQMLGADAANSVRGMVKNAAEGSGSIFATILGIATLIYGATSMFFHLQKSLNQVWGVKADPKFAGWKKLIVDRVSSFGLILVVAFLLLISLVISAGLAVLSNWIREMLPAYAMYGFRVLDFIISFGIVTFLFALIYKYLPDVNIHWRDVWIGAAVTAFLFVVGKTLLGIYFGQTEPGSTYGAAGSIILIMLWVSYSCLILFFGAEFTQVFARRFGERIAPSSHAVRVLSYEEEIYSEKNENEDDEAKNENKDSST